MSQDSNTTRRNVIKTTGAALTGLAGGATVLGSGSAVVIRDWRLLFISEDGAGWSHYSASVPNDDLVIMHEEGHDDVVYRGDMAHIGGKVKDGWGPFGKNQDEYKFNGDRDDISWDADSGVEVILEDGAEYDDER